LTPNPILKVLSTLRSSNVRFLLMGGQACVFYGAAEFSRDTDILLPLDDENLERFTEALEKLEARRIAVPELSREALERGHAAHYRCQAPEVAGMRVDVMSVLRGVDSFEKLWERRTSVETEEGERIELMGLADLVAAKKTQRDKDWPMLRRLVEAHYAQHREHPEEGHVLFWLKEARTPRLLAEVCGRWPDLARMVSTDRPLLKTAMQQGEMECERELAIEEQGERTKDRVYWNPLKAELERLRHARRNT
jgi:hypothetical protein